MTKNENENRSIQEWHYCSVIGQTNLFSGTTRFDIIFAVHQCAKYSIDPKKSREEAAKKIKLYLNKTKDKDLFFTPNVSNVIKCYADADLSGYWCREDVDQLVSVL